MDDTCQLWLLLEGIASGSKPSTVIGIMFAHSSKQLMYKTS